MSPKDGFVWTESQGLQSGVPSIGVIQPPSNLKNGQNDFDAIVIGGGYCGLTAARDATAAGLKILLLEARDRVGGRSWSSNIGDYPFEMGGTWVHWGQPHVWREISRYGMRDEIEVSLDFSRGINEHHMKSPDGLHRMSHDEEDAIAQSGLGKFVNVDGEYGAKLIPFPHAKSHSPETIKYDDMSAAERLASIKHLLTPQELTSISSFVLLCGGGTLETTSFFEFLHWWALCGYSYKGCVEYLMKYKLKHGQSSLSRRIFDEAASTGNLSYSFNSPVQSISDKGAPTQVVTRSGAVYRARRVVSTVPLNVLRDVQISPPLGPERQAAIAAGHINQCVKVHAEVRDRHLRSWTGVNLEGNGLIFAFGDGTTPVGNTHIVCFGAQHNHFEPDADIKETMGHLQRLVPMDIERVVFHNWSKDEFAKGAWFFSAPGFLSKYLESLRTRHGNILFASSDWALGWRSFIDGAIEEGTRAAATLTSELSGRPTAKI